VAHVGDGGEGVLHGEVRVGVVPARERQERSQGMRLESSLHGLHV
jgi:hypothetical protein